MLGAVGVEDVPVALLEARLVLGRHLWEWRTFEQGWVAQCMR